MSPLDEQAIPGDDFLDDTPAGASSIEDFWMFFTFAMILLVFVLMNYVNYLYAMVVELEKDAQEQQEEVQTLTDVAEPGLDEEIRIYVKKLVHGVLYHFDDDEDELLALGDMETGLRRRVDDLANRQRKPRRLTVFVHAPGDVLYQDVFNASYAAWELAHPEGTMPFELEVSLVYQEAKD